MSATRQLTSYFPNVIESSQSRLGKSYYTGIALRDSDFYIMERQNPIGWAFFHKSNVEYLVKKCQKYKPGCDFGDISAIMIEVYETEASEEPAQMHQQTAVVAQLNEITLKKFAVAQFRLAQGIYNYNKLLAQPNRSAYAPLPSNDRVDRSLYIDRKNIVI